MQKRIRGASFCYSNLYKSIALVIFFWCFLLETHFWKVNKAGLFLRLKNIDFKRLLAYFSHFGESNYRFKNIRYFTQNQELFWCGCFFDF